jgi:hypothetical protein
MIGSTAYCRLLLASMIWLCFNVLVVREDGLGNYLCLGGVGWCGLDADLLCHSPSVVAWVLCCLGAGFWTMEPPTKWYVLVLVITYAYRGICLLNFLYRVGNFIILTIHDDASFCLYQGLFKYGCLITSMWYVV